MNSLPVQHVAATPKKTNKIWLIVLVVILLCCLCSCVSAGLGYFYYQSNGAGIGGIINTFVQPSQTSGIEKKFNNLFQLSQVIETKPGEERRSEEGGYTFITIPGYDALPGWAVSGGYILDSKDINIDDPNFVIGEGPQIILDGYAPLDDLTFEKYVENGKSDWKLRSKATISGEPQVSIAGLKGAAFDYDYELAGAGKMKARDVSVEVNPKQFFSIVCRSTVEKWDKTLAACDAVIQSITFFEPAPSPTQTP